MRDTKNETNLINAKTLVAVYTGGFDYINIEGKHMEFPICLSLFAFKRGKDS